MILIENEDFDIKKIADSGQCFRLQVAEDKSWRLIAGNRLLEGLENRLFCSEQEFSSFWKSYFDLDFDYAAVRAAVPADDGFLQAAADYGKGIRILRQDPWEMLITFIISQRKNIPAIASCVETISQKWGEEIADGIFAFPDAERLAGASEEDLRACSLGYRAPYILSSARRVADGTADLEAFRRLSDEELTEELLKFSGVGPKVANCVSLFAYHRIDAFPIDVWIARTLKEQYNDRFPFELYKGFAGIIQQYMFFYARNQK